MTDNLQQANMTGALISFGAMFGITVSRENYSHDGVFYKVELATGIEINVIEDGEQTWDVQFWAGDSLLDTYCGYHDYVQVMRTVGALALPHVPIEIG